MFDINKELLSPKKFGELSEAARSWCRRITSERPGRVGVGVVIGLVAALRSCSTGPLPSDQTRFLNKVVSECKELGRLRQQWGTRAGATASEVERNINEKYAHREKVSGWRCYIEPYSFAEPDRSRGGFRCHLRKNVFHCRGSDYCPSGSWPFEVVIEITGADLTRAKERMFTGDLIEFDAVREPYSQCAMQLEFASVSRLDVVKQETFSKEDWWRKDDR